MLSSTHSPRKNLQSLNACFTNGTLQERLCAIRFGPNLTPLHWTLVSTMRGFLTIRSTVDLARFWNYLTLLALLCIRLLDLGASHQSFRKCIKRSPHFSQLSCAIVIRHPNFDTSSRHSSGIGNGMLAIGYTGLAKLHRLTYDLLGSRLLCRQIKSIALPIDIQALWRFCECEEKLPMKRHHPNQLKYIRPRHMEQNYFSD